MGVELVIIDPQNDFCDPNGSLFVNGADQDCIRLAQMIKRIKANLDDIHVTMDSHHYIDIAHPVMWKDQNGKHPTPFTIITASDIINGKFHTTNPGWNKRAIEYVKALEKNGRYPLCIWPPHCLIGSWGYSINKEVFDALLDWEKDFAMVDFVTKGSNLWTEHYSAVQADVPDSNDPGTMLNTRLIETLEKADQILLSGQALSHCVANTVRDIANNFGEDSIKKMVLLIDTTSPVTNFEQMAKDFVKELTGRGMRIAESTEM